MAEVKNIYYINFNPRTDGQTPPFNAQLEAIRANVNLNAQFLSFKANREVKSKLASGDLEDEGVRKANYAAQVINYYKRNSLWAACHTDRKLKLEFTGKKSAFHKALVTTFTDGWNLPGSIVTDLEGILNEIKNTIKGPAGEKRGLTFLILLTSFEKDDVLQEWQPHLRTICVKVDESLSRYIRNGDHNEVVAITIEYVQTDGGFDNRLFEEKAKAGIQKVLETEKNVSTPVEISI